MSADDVTILTLLWWIGGYSLACWAWHLRYQQMVWQVRAFAALAAFAGPAVGLEWAILHCVCLHREWRDSTPRCHPPRTKT